MIDFKVLGGFDNGQTDGQTDIGSCRVAFATENVFLIDRRMRKIFSGCQ